MFAKEWIGFLETNKNLNSIDLGPKYKTKSEQSGKEQDDLK